MASHALQTPPWMAHAKPPGQNNCIFVNFIQNHGAQITTYLIYRLSDENTQT